MGGERTKRTRCEKIDGEIGKDENKREEAA
jgi:hypothetical protein